MIAGFIIWSVVCVIFIILGITSRRSKTPSGFWANVKAPEVTDIKSYNRAVSNIWFVFAALFELLGVPLLFLEQNSPLIFLSVLGCVLLVIGIMCAYMRVERKYRRK